MDDHSAQNNGPNFHMTPDEFRRAGHATVEWLARYMEQVAELPVTPDVAPGWVRAQLPDAPPERGEAWEGVLADLDTVIVPGLTHWQSPRFFAYFPANASGPAVLGDLVSAGLGVQGMSWSTSPACTEVETHMCDWLLDLLGLPPRFRSDGPGGGVIQDSASSATLCVLVAARDRAIAEGAALGDLRVYVSDQTHSSVEKDARVAGLAMDQLVSVATDATHAMRADVLAAAMAADREAGRVPFLVVATVGTTGSTAIDPVSAIAEAATPFGAWVHVDAAFAGSAAVCPEFRFVTEGADLVDSWSFNPHKWLFTNFDCSVLWVADRRPLIEALAVLPEYLRNEASESGEVIDYRDWQIPLGRRFRALKLWFVIRHYGAEGLAHHVRRHVALAQGFLERVDADDRFELAAPAPLSLVCLRHADGDDATQRVIDGVNGSGRAFVTHTRLDDRLVMRVCVGQTWTEQHHLDDLWAVMDEVA